MQHLCQSLQLLCVFGEPKAQPMAFIGESQVDALASALMVPMGGIRVNDGDK